MKHNWRSAPSEILRNLDRYLGRKDFDVDITRRMKSSMFGFYVCDRCGSLGRIVTAGYPSKNWDSNCDESLVSIVHET